MRVLMTTDTIGGVWTFTRELASELLQQDHSVALVSFGRSPSPEQLRWCAATQARHGDLFRYDASCTPLEWMAHNQFACPEAEQILLRVADAFSPDLLHSNQFCFGSLPLDIPKLITAHSDVLSWAAACRPEGLPSSPWLQRYKSLVAKGIEAADAITAPTRWMLNALCERFPFAQPGWIVHNGRSLPLRPQIAPATAQAATVGRLWDEGKNLRLLTRVDSPFPILAAGEKHHEDAALMTKHLGPVTLLGHLAEDELLTLFHQSSIYIAPSIYEPFGLAPLEAALCHCAVLANDIPSLREVWGDSAFYFTDDASLTKLLSQLHASPATLEAARHRSHQRARHLSARRMAEQYLDVYESLLGSVSHPPAQELAAHGF